MNPHSSLIDWFICCCRFLPSLSLPLSLSLFLYPSFYSFLSNYVGSLLARVVIILLTRWPRLERPYAFVWRWWFSLSLENSYQIECCVYERYKNIVVLASVCSTGTQIFRAKLLKFHRQINSESRRQMACGGGIHISFSPVFGNSYQIECCIYEYYKTMVMLCSIWTISTEILSAVLPE